jgi:hypothetical protein
MISDRLSWQRSLSHNRQAITVRTFELSPTKFRLYAIAVGSANFGKIFGGSREKESAKSNYAPIVANFTRDPSLAPPCQGKPDLDRQFRLKAQDPPALRRLKMPYGIEGNQIAGTRAVASTKYGIANLENLPLG